jgi:hypothetical protein
MRSLGDGAHRTGRVRFGNAEVISREVLKFLARNRLSAGVCCFPARRKVNGPTNAEEPIEYMARLSHAKELRDGYTDKAAVRDEAVRRRRAQNEPGKCDRAVWLLPKTHPHRRRQLLNGNLVPLAITELGEDLPCMPPRKPGDADTHAPNPRTFGCGHLIVREALCDCGAMAQWATNDGPVLAAVARLLRDSEHVSENQVLAELGRSADGRLEVMRSMRLLIQSDYIGGKVNTGDTTIQDVMVTGLTEKGLMRLGLSTGPNQELVAALIAALNAAAEPTEPKEAGELRKAAKQLGRITRDVLVGVLTAAIRDSTTRLGLP